MFKNLSTSDFSFLTIFKHLFFIGVFVFFIFSILFVEFTKDANAASTDDYMKNIIFGKEQGYNSLLDFENGTALIFENGENTFKMLIRAVGFIVHCLESSKSFDFGSLRNECIPYKLGPHEPNPCKSRDFKDTTLLDGSLVAAYVARLIIEEILIDKMLKSGNKYIKATGLALFWLKNVPLIDVCFSHYILTPSEYYMANGGLNDASSISVDNISCKATKGGNIYIDMAKQSNYLTNIELPYFYSCSKTSSYKGYVGTDMELCGTKSKDRAMPNLAHKIIIGKTSLLDRIAGAVSSKGRAPCAIKDDEFLLLDPQSRDISYFGYTYFAFYRMHESRIELCAVASSIILPFPVVLGCTSVPPPTEEYKYPKEYNVLFDGTKCKYILPGNRRMDLMNLSTFISKDAKDTNSVTLFLESDWHIISTVSTCIQDLLTKVFIDNTVNPDKAFMAQIENGMKSIVFATLLLYITLIGIKILMNNQEPTRGEWMIYLMKFAVVLAITTTGIWFDKSDANPRGIGLYKTLIESGQFFADIFMQARNSGDPIQMCSFNYKGKNVLSQNDIDIGGGEIVKMTVWDYLDCVLATYLNFNSCKFSMSGMVVFWFTSCAIFSFPLGFVLAIAMLIYCVMVLLIILQFMHIAILTMFAITVLVMISPIMMCFFLFDTTKDITMSWFKLLLGYMLYPGMIFAFMAFMLTTFDYIFYGLNTQDKIDALNSIRTECGANPDKCTITDVRLKKICGNKEPEKASVYCAMLASMKDHGGSLTNCSLKTGAMTTILTEEWLMSPFFGYVTRLRVEVISDFFDPVVQLALFAMLFYFFLRQVTHLLSMLLGVEGMTGFAIAGAIGVVIGKKMLGTMTPGVTTFKSGESLWNNRKSIIDEGKDMLNTVKETAKKGFGK